MLGEYYIRKGIYTSTTTLSHTRVDYPINLFTPMNVASVDSSHLNGKQKKIFSFFVFFGKLADKVVIVIGRKVKENNKIK